MAQKTSGFFEILKNSLQQWFDEIKHSQHKLFEVVLAFGAGCLFGFILKRYSNFIGALVIFIAGLFVLHHMGYMQFNFNSALIESTFGIKPVPFNSDGLGMLLAWVKLNAVLSISFIIGALVGLKLA